MPVVLIMSFVAKGFSSELRLVCSCIMSCLFSLLQSGAVAQFFSRFHDFTILSKIEGQLFSRKSLDMGLSYVSSYLDSGDVPLAGM